MTAIRQAEGSSPPDRRAVLGIDTHKNSHAVAVLDELGRPIAAGQFATTAAGVEGTGSYGYQLTRTLQRAGYHVLEVNRPDRAQRRRRGKNDATDAEAAARSVLSGQATAVPKDRSGAVEALRARTIARDSAVKASTQAVNQAKALLVTAEHGLRAALPAAHEPGRKTTKTTTKTLMQALVELPPSDATSVALRALARRWLFLAEEISEADTAIRSLVRSTAPGLLERPGIGVHCAARLLITAGDNPHRLRSDAAFAALCGATPVEASSGQTHRHRLNRGGDRQANRALWTIAHVRLVHDPRTRAFANRRRTESGDSRKETLRVLMRYIAREVHNLIVEARGDVGAAAA